MRKEIFATAAGKLPLPCLLVDLGHETTTLYFHNYGWVLHGCMLSRIPLFQQHHASPAQRGNYAAPYMRAHALATNGDATARKDGKTGRQFQKHANVETQEAKFVLI